MDSRRIDSQAAMRHNLETFSTYAASFPIAAGEAVEQHPLFVKSAAAHGRQLSPPLDITNPQHQRYLEQLRHWLSRPTLEQAVAAVDSSASQPTDEQQVTPAATTEFSSDGFDERRLRRDTGIRRTASSATPRIAASGSLSPGGPSLWDQAAQRGQTGSREADNVTSAVPDGKPAAAFAGSEVDSLAAAIARLEAVERARSQSSNPLDPEEFNRRFGPK